MLQNSFRKEISLQMTHMDTYKGVAQQHFCENNFRETQNSEKIP